MVPKVDVHVDLHSIDVNDIAPPTLKLSDAKISCIIVV